MENWKQITTVSVEVPVRSAGNIVKNTPVDYTVYNDGTLFKAIPLCDETQMKLANLKEEILFSFHLGKAISTNGITDGNQHIVERIGAELKARGLHGQS